MFIETNMHSTDAWAADLAPSLLSKWRTLDTSIDIQRYRPGHTAAHVSLSAREMTIDTAGPLRSEIRGQI